MQHGIVRKTNRQGPISSLYNLKVTVFYFAPHSVDWKNILQACTVHSVKAVVVTGRADANVSMFQNACIACKT